MSDEEKIDLQKLSQKELLIVTHEKVKAIAESMDKLTAIQQKHEVRISLVESRIMMWGAIFGLLGAGVLNLVLSFFKS